MVDVDALETIFDACSVGRVRASTLQASVLPWRIEWVAGVGYTANVPSDPLILIDVCLAQLPGRDESAEREMAFLSNEDER